MAESFLFNIAEKVLEKVASVALQEIGLAWGVKSELNKLENTLSTIKAVLMDAEEQQDKNRQLVVWLGKLKDICYDAEDVLEEFEYEALRQQVVSHGGYKTKVRNFFSHSSLSFRFEMGHKIKEIGERLDEVAAEKAKFHLTERAEDRHLVHTGRETYSFVQPSDVIGRDNDKKNILRLLMRSSNQLSVISIVGIGGLGKTTLARLVYNDVKVNELFELKMWVYVSDDFDVKKLMKEIINCATGTNCGDLSMEQMQTLLRGTLRDKLFLLILDDVWNKDHGKWMELKNLLSEGASESKVIVTTRSPLVASIMGTGPIYKLGGLPYNNCLSLFVKWAFREGQDKQYPNLLKIGNEIVKKCGGIPLAVRTLGIILYLKTDERDWQYVKTNEIWKLEQTENDILPALKMCYDALPAYLKQCFAFCSLFPRGYEFNSLELIRLWMAQGLLRSSSENQDLEDIGRQYIKELWWRSFFQGAEGYQILPFLKFKMHDLFHDLALSVAQTEYSTIKTLTQNISTRVRHVSICENVEDPRFLLKLNNVRTILFPPQCGRPTNQSFLDMCISRFKYLRVLSLPCSCFEVFPSSIGSLKRLRYLFLYDNHCIKKLPDSICNLQSLQSLGLYGFYQLEELPRNIGNLINLRYLVLTTKHMFLPDEGIGGLKSLQSLEIWRCSNLRFLGEGMQRLTALRTLFIVACRNLESLPCMKYLTALETLVIWDCEKLILKEWEEDTQGLRFNLRWLTISGLPKLEALPQWIHGAANTLQHLCIENCYNLKTLPKWLQNLSIQKLGIYNCPKVRWFAPRDFLCSTTLGCRSHRSV